MEKLQGLDASFCGSAITDKSLLTLSTGLPDLQGLSIRGCVQVTDLGIMHIKANAIRLVVLN